MEIEKNVAMRKETAWKIKLDKNVMLVLNAVEDSSLPEPNVSVVLSEGDRKVSFTMTKDRFLNLTGVLDSFSQVCLGVEPVLAQEDYAVHEPKVTEKKVEKAEPAPVPKPKAEKVETPAKFAEEPRPATPAPPAPAKQPEPVKASTAESRMLAKLEGAKSSTPPKIAFPPRFPSASIEADEELEPEEMKESEPMEDLAQLDFGIPEPTPPVQAARPTLAPPAKPSPPPTAMPKITKEPAPAPTAKPGKAEEDDETAPEWDPW